MPNVIELDFSKAPPATGAAISDHFTPGRYELVVASAEKTTAQTGRSGIITQLRVAEGPLQGKRLVERFYFPRNAEESQFGLQRFHSFLISLGFKEQSGKAKLDLDKLAGKRCIADIDDVVTPANDQYAERTISQALAFIPANSTQPTAEKAEAKPAKAEKPVAEEAEQAELAEATEATAEEALALDPDKVSAQLDELFE